MSDTGKIIALAKAVAGGNTAEIEADVENLKSAIDEKIDEPETEGTSGQVLTTDGNGGRSWTTVQGGGGTSDYTDLENKPQIAGVTLTGNKSLYDLGIAAESEIPTVHNVPSGGTADQVLAKNSGTDYDLKWANIGSPTDAQVGTAVANWLDDHPDATTTVQDGSVTKAKLSSTLQDDIRVFYDNLESGSISGTDGTNTTASTRCRTVGYIKLDEFWYCVMPTGYNLIVFLYDKNKTFLGRGYNSFQRLRADHITVNKLLYPTCEYIRLAFAKAAGGNIDQTDIDALKTSICYSKFAYDHSARELQRYSDELSEEVADIAQKTLSFCYASMEVGSLDASGAKETSTVRARTADYIDIDDFICCNYATRDDYKLMVFLYDKDKTYLERIPMNFSNININKISIKAINPDVKYVKFVFSDARGNYTLDDSDLFIISQNIFLKSSAMKIQADRSRFDKQFNYIAYSHLSTDDAPINTEEHYLNCAKDGKFTALKGDVQPTSDGGLIMCHDDGYTFDGNSKIIAYSSSSNTKIDTLTLQQCKALTFAEQYQGKDCHPTDFETFIKICKKYGLIAFITVRDSQIASVVAPAVMALLKRYRMLNHCIINSFTKDTLKTFRALNDSIMLSMVLDHNEAPTTDDVDFVASLGNCLLNLFDVPVQNAQGRYGEDVLDDVLTGYASILTYAYNKGVVVYEAQTGNAYMDVLLKHGITGSQMYVKPDYDWHRT